MTSRARLVLIVIAALTLPAAVFAAFAARSSDSNGPAMEVRPSSLLRYQPTSSRTGYGAISSGVPSTCDSAYSKPEGFLIVVPMCEMTAAELTATGALLMF